MRLKRSEFQSLLDLFSGCVCVRCACATVYVPVSSAFWVEPQQRDETRERARDLDGSDQEIGGYDRTMEADWRPGQMVSQPYLTVSALEQTNIYRGK